MYANLAHKPPTIWHFTLQLHYGEFLRANASHNEVVIGEFYIKTQCTQYYLGKLIAEIAITFYAFHFFSFFIIKT